MADAPAMGRVMVESFLSAHRGQMPEPAYQKRVAEWTPDVSARAWARALAERAEGQADREVFLVAEDEGGAVLGLVSGGALEDDPCGTVAEIGALYVRPDRHGVGIGSALMSAAAARLAEQGFVELRISVLTVNLPARAFYQAMGGSEVAQGTVDEEGYLLPVTIYAWPDVSTIVRDGGAGSSAPSP